jgi:mono/diheme cytochrome c family protein
MTLLRFVLAAACLLAACGGPVDEGPVDSGAPPDTGVACDPSLTYANFGQAFFTAHCNSCHGFTQSVAEGEAATLSGAVLGGFMPPGGGSLTPSDRLEFADWLACGAP